MYTLIISLAAAAIAGWLSSMEYSPAWTVVNTAAVFAGCWIGIGLYIRHRINKVNGEIQDGMEDAQRKINRKLQMFQNRPGANVKSIRKTLEKDQNAAISEALKATHKIDCYFKWNFLLKKQIDTMRMMFYYQMKDFKKVDELLPGCMYMDPRAAAFKIARMYRRKSGDIDTFFAKKCRRLKGENAALLYGLYSWILVKEGEADKALQLLTSARRKTDHPAIVENREKLANGNIKQFSNAGLGELWYSLYLEEPKVKQKKIRRKF